MGRPARREVGLTRADIDGAPMGEVGSRLEKRAALTIIDSYLLDVVKAQLAKVYLSVLGVAQFHAVIVDADMLRPHGSDIDGIDASHAAIILELDARKIAQRIGHRTAIEPPQGLAIKPLAAYHHALGYSHTDHIHILQGMDTIAHDDTGHRGNGDEQAKQPRKHPFLVQTHFLLLCLKTGSTISFMIEPIRNISSCIDLSSKAAGASAMAGLLTRCL